ncbi:hypothetical protein MMC25_007611 [Agyrium rufum]|nr:hypothetical protein [Agyrium rufum]
MSSPPPGPPPQGSLGPNNDRGPAAVAVVWVQAAIAIIVVVLRFWSRRLIRSTGADDWWMLATLITFVAIAADIAYQSSLGGFRHIYYVPPENLKNVGINNYVQQALGIFAFGTSKASVGCLILRLLPPTSFWRKWTLWAVIVFTVFYNWLNIIITFIQCSPPRALWEPEIPHTCWAPKVQTDISYVGSSYNIVIDFYLALLPITILRNLNMSLRKRVNLCILLGLSCLAGICSIVKITYLGSLGDRGDLTYNTYNLIVWSSSEIFIIIVCASVPPMKPLWDRYIRKKELSRGPKSAYSSGSRKNQYAMMPSNKSKSRKVTSSIKNSLESHEEFSDGNTIMRRTEIDVMHEPMDV